MAFRIYRNNFNYWLNRKVIISPERVKQLAMVRYAHKLSNSSSGARTVATISTNEGLPRSRYVARKRMLDLNFMSCQLLKHRYKNTGCEHNLAPNHLNREFKVDQPNQVWCGDVHYI